VDFQDSFELWLSSDEFDGDKTLDLHAIARAQKEQKSRGDALLRELDAREPDDAFAKFDENMRLRAAMGLRPEDPDPLPREIAERVIGPSRLPQEVRDRLLAAAANSGEEIVEDVTAAWLSGDSDALRKVARQLVAR
jgi:hypothetical protein